MPPQILAMLQQRNIQIILAVVVVLVIAIPVVMNFNKAPTSPDAKPVDEKLLTLATVEGEGKAIEIQAILARNGVKSDKEPADNKIAIKLQKGATEADKDRAILSLVRSGMLDKNVGLEAFDKGDLTASREEKKIKLVRAQQGELARFIKKIGNIQDATVSISIPEQTLFRSQQKPLSASIQVQLMDGERLNRDEVRSIINLATGAIQGLDAQHVALIDTHGNTYNSVLDVGSELNDKLEEQDSYMKQKVASQLDKLVGSGNYVVTVSTLLREAAKETLVQQYDPERSVIASKQAFNENMNSKSGGASSSGGATSSFLPNTVANAMGGGSGSNNRDYDRTGTEVSYDNTKTQSYESSMPGMIEDISIAVTIDKGHYPDSIQMQELQALLAHAASPKVNPGSVSVLTVDFEKPTMFTGAAAGGAGGYGEGASSHQDYSWIYWAGGAILALVALSIVVGALKGRGPDPMEVQATQNEIQQLKELAGQQQAALQAQQRQTQMILEAQQKQLAEKPQPVAITSNQQAEELKQTLAELRQTVQEDQLDDEDLNLQIKSWIESS